ncbi:MAG TPA: hypothetical protein VFB37_05470 [Steroidobacteraceae bacterium]|nr:hypothetical protein [Steroidobacteraceae bacterium]
MVQRSAGRFLTSLVAAGLLCSGALAWSQSGTPARSQPGGQTQTGSPPTAPADQPSRTPSPSPPPEELEPGVNTSATPPSQDSSATPAGAAESAARTPEQSSHSETGKTTTGSRSQRASGSAKESATPRTDAGSGKAHDKIELDTTQITGNRELPKVLYIVPWKRSDLGDLVGKPVNSLIDEVLTPVDRDVFRRQNRYYDALKPDAAKDAAAGSAAKP